jgi:GNAT superfamily N-acetyltransferase
VGGSADDGKAEEDVRVDARAATVDDAEEVVRLGALMFASMGMDASGDEWTRNGVRHVRSRLGHDLAVFVVDHPGVRDRLVASAAGTLASRLPTPVNPSGLAGYIQWVCTDPEHQRQGLGRQVMAALLDWFDARGVRSVELHSTPVAESLYTSMGFSDDGPRALRRRSW